MTGTTISSYTTIDLLLSDPSQNPVTITTAGTIDSQGGFAIYSTGGGNHLAWSITNYGLIVDGTPGGTGINLSGDTVGVTITNAGTIGAAIGRDAVTLGSGNNLVVVDPGAVFSGYVDGGSGHDNTLALASAATIGTLNPTIGHYLNFQSLTVATSAYWVLPDSETIGVGVVLTNAGTINTIDGNNEYIAGGALTNQSTGVIHGYGVYGSPGFTNSLIDNIGLISNAYGVRLGDGGTVANLGTITASNETPPGYGVYSKHGGTITNGASGVHTALIESYGGIRFVGGTDSSFNGYITNFGTMLADGGSFGGIELQQGGTVTNGSSTDTAALVQGSRFGVYVWGGTVTNYGTISGTLDGAGYQGVVMEGGAEHLANLGPDALIEGYYGVSVSYGTITNFGTIASNVGNAGTAVLFNAGPNLLIIQPGAKFIGMVEGGAVDGGAIELAGTVAATLSGLGTQFTNFGTVQIDPGSRWSLAGASTITAGSTIDVAGSLGVAGAISGDASFIIDGGTINLASYSDVGPGSGFDFVALASTDPTLILGGAGAESIIATTTVATTIGNFAAPDTIDLPALTFHTGATATVSGNTLAVVSSGETVDLSVSGLINGTSYSAVTDGGSGIEIIACFVTGTRIATPSGEVAVEHLSVGDAIRTHGGNIRAVRWIGWRSHAAEVVAANPHLRPVRVRAHTLAPGVPARDLLLSPSHALLVDEVLIPAGALVNGVSIVRDPVGAVAYFHIELDRHDILLAEGAPAESFIDIAGREMFANAADYLVRTGEDLPASLPRIEEGAMVQAVRRRLAVRAGIATALFSPGPLRGHVERIVASDDGMARTIEGWVLDDADPDEPVELDVITEAGPPLRLPANRYRLDLDRAGLAGGRCGFSLRLPGRGPVLVRRAADGKLLPMAA